MHKEIYRILAINPGSTSTKFGVYENEKCIFEHTIRHDRSDLESCDSIIGQKELRENLIISTLNDQKISLSEMDAVVGRGGIVKPLESGTYSINDSLLYDLTHGEATVHASALGGIIAKEIGDIEGIPNFIVDPVVVDELCPEARVTGIKNLERRSIFHALNTKAVARRVCNKIGKRYEDSRLIVAHLGGGITVGAHLNGKVIDVNDAKSGVGPFTPERTGTAPLLPVIDMCFSGEYTKDQLYDMVIKGGGMLMLLGTNDLRKAEEMIENGDAYANLVVKAMAYQVSKEIGAMCAVLNGSLDGIILTGGLAYSENFTKYIENKVSKFGEIFILPGEDELLALVEGTLAVLRNERQAKEYV